MSEYKHFQNWYNQNKNILVDMYEEFLKDKEGEKKLFSICEYHDVHPTKILSDQDFAGYIYSHRFAMEKVKRMFYTNPSPDRILRKIKKVMIYPNHATQSIGVIPQ